MKPKNYIVNFFHDLLRHAIPLCGVAFGFLISCQKNGKEAQALFQAKNTAFPGAEIENFTTYYTLKGNIALILKAPLMKDYSNEKFPFQLFPKGVDIVIVNHNDDGKTYIKADKAAIYQQTGITELSGNVIIRNDKNEQLLTPHLFWDKKNEHIFTDEQVEFRRGNEFIKGKGFDSNMQFNNARVNNVEGIFNIKKS